MHPRRLPRPFLSPLMRHKPRFRPLENHTSRRNLVTRPDFLLTCSIPELHRYTRGRWLIDDILERKARHVSFNLEELCAVVIGSCPGAAQRITALERKEGSNALVLIFSLDNGRKVVAELPTSVAGPKRLTTNAEVATVEYSMFWSVLQD
jgi:hypothetical protein